METGAVIVAAGLSSRMQAFKPMLELEKSTIIKKQIETFNSIGIKDIIVVTGRNAELLQEHLRDFSVKFIYNPIFDKSDMFYSACRGLSGVADHVERIFFSPCDAPLFSAETLMKMTDFMDTADFDILTPTCCQKQGHPLLINRGAIEEILKFKGKGGLRGAIDSVDCKKASLEVWDFGVVMDADFPEDYERLKTYARNMAKGKYRTPTDKECFEMLDFAKTPNEVINHCKAVSFVAVALAERLESLGNITLNRDLLLSAGLLHDICRREKNHAAIGAKLLFEKGFYDVAYLVAQHMEIGTNLRINEASLLWLSDKCCDGDEISGPIMRFAAKRNKYGDNKEALEKIEKTGKSAIEIIKLWENATGENFNVTLEFIKKIYSERKI